METSEPNGTSAPPEIAALSIKAGATFSAKCSIYSANVTVSADSNLEQGLKSATKKDLPKSFPFEMVFFSKEEHDKQTQDEADNAGFGSVFRGHQGLCPRLGGEYPARLFIGQSTDQTTGMSCHMSGRFIPTVERGSIDLANVHVSKWNKELLCVGGFLARMAYDFEMREVRDAWSKLSKADAEALALYTMKSFVFHRTTPDSNVSHIIKDAFFACSTTKKILFISDQGIRPTKDIRRSHGDFDPFMRTPVVRKDLDPLLKSMQFPDCLKVKQYQLSDIAKELESLSLPEAVMVAFLRWWSTSCGRLDISPERRTEWRSKFLKVGRAEWQGKEVKLSSISKFIDKPMLDIRGQEDPLPGDAIPPALIRGVELSKISDTLGWEKMTIAHWLRYLKGGIVDPAHDITKAPEFAQRVLSVLSALWQTLDENSRSEVREILQDVPCIPTTISNVPSMKRPRDAYFPYVDIFRNLPVVKQQLPVESITEQVLQYLGVQKRCDIDALIKQLNSDDRWNVMDLARYLGKSPQEDVTRVMDKTFFPCSDGKRHYITKVFTSTATNRALGLPVVKCDSWNSNSEEAICLTRQGLREYPTIEELITIASSESDGSARQAAWLSLCGPSYETELGRHFDPSKFLSHAFIPGVRDGQPCQFFHHEVC
ncbi:uncharacterized protein EDB91DRAFT_142270 [Suillus paluster]|uniref:uncharacterized protein n=1 Tax=Suillus paluster TaxID=48578 RepID=UPI001B8815B5|nr:uncharacterized protein EDB91DRAFT_142270 [Suillus paluster]KAG1724397.1 hypothetical protein EDB91DRAFT_142270 [Suillus paluster]